MIDPILISAGIAVLLFGGMFASWWYSAVERARRTLNNVVLTTVGDLVVGASVKITGRVKSASAPLLRSPLRGVECVAYCTSVDEYQEVRDNDTWTALAHESRGVKFVLDDGTGTVEVRVGAEGPFWINRGARGLPNIDGDAPAPVKAFLQRHGKSDRGFVFAKKLCTTERLVAVGDTVTIGGLVTDAGPGEVGSTSRKLAIVAPAEGVGRVILA